MSLFIYYRDREIEREIFAGNIGWYHQPPASFLKASKVSSSSSGPMRKAEIHFGHVRCGRCLKIGDTTPNT